MIKTIAVLLLTSAFLAGYYVGRLPGAPDVFAWGRETYQKAADYSNKAATTVNETRGFLRSAAEPTGKAVVEIGGKLYRIGERPAERR